MGKFHSPSMRFELYTLSYYDHEFEISSNTPLILNQVRGK